MVMTQEYVSLEFPPKIYFLEMLSPECNENIVLLESIVIKNIFKGKIGYKKIGFALFLKSVFIISESIGKRKKQSLHSYAFLLCS